MEILKKLPEEFSKQTEIRLKNKDRYIGTHLIMDMTTNDISLFRNTGLTEEYLLKCIDIGEMTCLLPPQVFTFPYASEHTRFLEKLEKEGTTSPAIKEAMKMYDYNKSEGSGNTGFAVLCESHTSIHTFPEKFEPFASACFYSCKEFDFIKIVQYTMTHYNIKEVYLTLMDRYIGLPQQIVQLHIKS
jgi:S-adenosylmethionine decarboxylase